MTPRDGVTAVVYAILAKLWPKVDPAVEIYDHVKGLVQAAREEALEEAARVVEGRKGIPEHHSDLAVIIRKLKKGTP